MGKGKQSALLAVLLLHRGEVVSTDFIIDALWGDRPPASALNSVRVYVSHLRKALGSERLLTRGRGYVLAVRPERVDLERFERLSAEGRERLAEGDARRAAEALRAALALVRGPPLVDFANEPFAQVEIPRLEELRLTALEERIEADLALGRHRELVAELGGLVRANPLRERLRMQLMVALYRAGRQAEALESYRQARRVLNHELGLEPGRALQALERAILSQDPELDPPVLSSASVTRSRRRSGLLIAIGAALLLATVLAVVLIGARGGSAGLDSVSANAVGVITADGNRLVADIPVGNGPMSVAAAEDAVWATNAEDDSVSRIDPLTRRVVENVDVGSQPSGVAISGASVWVANSLDGSVMRIDRMTSEVVQNVTGIVTPTAVAAGFGSIWVVSVDGRSVKRIDAASGDVVDTIPTGGGPWGIAVGAGSVWVTDQSSRSVLRIDPASSAIIETIGVGDGPTAIAFCAGSVWVTNSLDGTVSRIDPSTNDAKATIGVGEGPNALACGSDAVWVSSEFSESIVRIDPAEDRVEKIPVGNRPTGLAVSGNEVWFAAQASGAGHRGGRLVVTVLRAAPSIDPALGGSLGLAYDGLVGAARRGGSAGMQIVPNLAVSLPVITAGETRYAFRLRPGSRYSDGTAVKASDFRRALERLFRVRAVAATSFGSLVGADACVRRPRQCDLSRGVRTDDAAGTIVIRLRRPDAEFLSRVAGTAPVPPGTPNQDIGTHPVPSTGPYMIESYVRGRHLRLVRNPYFGVRSNVARPDGFPDEIEFRLGMTEDAAFTAVARGQADVLLSVPVDRLEEVRTRYASQLHLHPLTGSMFFVFLNTTLPPFDDLRVRQAVNFAVDRAAVARAMGGPELAEPFCQIRPPSVPGHLPYCPYTVDPTRTGEWKAPDLARARRLVAASGTKGAKVTLWTWTLRMEPAALEVVAALERLGYRTSLRRLPTIDDYFPKVLDRKTKLQAGMFGWLSTSGLLPSYVLPYLTCGAIRAASQNNNPGFFCDRRIDARIRHALRIQEGDPDAAAELWPSIERELVDRAPWVPLFTPKEAHFVSRRVGNYQYSPAAGILLDQLWVR